MKKTALFLIFFLIISCKKENKNSLIDNNNLNSQQDKHRDQQTFKSNVSDSIHQPKNSNKKDITNILVDSSAYPQNHLLNNEDFVNLKELSSDFVYDLKYATVDNFLKQAVYDCPECYLRKNTALALVKANDFLKLKGYKMLIYDCYRPLDVQKKMWAILPGTNYVANPQKGSKHNRGAAVDLTLIDKNGKVLDMGTPFDFFGREAHHTYLNHPKEVLDNRKLLKETMNAANFRSIASEWWHYEYRPDMHKPVSNFKWDCD